MQSANTKLNRKIFFEIFIGIITLLTIIFALVGALTLCLNYLDSRTHPSFSDRFIIGSTYERIVRRYGEPHYRNYDEQGILRSITYNRRLPTEMSAHFSIAFDENGRATHTWVDVGG